MLFLYIALELGDLKGIPRWETLQMTDFSILRPKCKYANINCASDPVVVIACAVMITEFEVGVDVNDVIACLERTGVGFQRCIITGTTVC
jgi:hypothetical protein